MTRLFVIGLVAVAFAFSTVQVSSFSSGKHTYSLHAQQRQKQQHKSPASFGLPKARFGSVVDFRVQSRLKVPASATSTSLYSAAADHFRQSGAVNGAAAAANFKTIPLSTNQGIFFGCLLAITSGIINGATLMGLWSNSQGTAALTGTFTKSAMYMAKGEWQTCLWYTKCLISWMAGSTIVGLLIPEPSAFEVKYPKGLAASLAIGATCLSFAGLSIGGPSFVLLCLMAQGIQDSVSSIMTANLCRTTHMTGIACDLGTFFGQRLRGNKDINPTKVRAFSLLTLSFCLGAFASFPLSTIFGPRMLLGVAGAYLSIAASIGVYYMRQKLLVTSA
ncbi:unnamed protein product [Cylindrotheca closterium]|uniref:Uncharacterized protein n=1 Tax=Cylindrotheca closterium TaxID=2856 RepID=A0AAD2CMH7_9STRA|nr:unnamed protein product [Cylindrotheca closterium]